MGSGASRLGDKAQVQQDSHGCPGCPHPGVGPTISGSPDVNINGLPALRVDDVGIHAACCGANMWSAAEGSSTVFVNGKPVVRKNDKTRHCGGQGKMLEGSDDVIIGGASSTGGGGDGGRSQAGRGIAGSTSSSAPTAHFATTPWATEAAKEPPPAPVSRLQAPLEVPLKTAWIEIALVDEEGVPVAGEEYRIELPDGSLRNGRLDDNGKARLLAIDDGTCVVTFPYIDAASWN